MPGIRPFDWVMLAVEVLDVEKWSEEVTKVLASYSQHAVAAFNHQAQVGTPYHHIATGAWPNYGKITARVENLRSIIEKPEIYY